MKITRLGWLIRGGVLAAVGAFAILPVYWMVVSSFKSEAELAAIPATLFPRSLVLDSYSGLFASGRMFRAVANSLIIAGASTVLAVAMASLAGYAIAFTRLKGKSPFLTGVLVTQMLPQAAAMIPVFILWARLGLLDSLPGISLAYFAFVLPVTTWVLTANFRSIPTEIVAAARVDGATDIQILRLVVFGMAGPGIAAATIFAFLWSWSEFLFALVMLSSESQTVTVFLSSLIEEHRANLGELMAAATLVSLPPFAVALLLQRRFTEGLTAGGMKG